MKTYLTTGISAALISTLLLLGSTIFLTPLALADHPAEDQMMSDDAEREQLLALLAVLQQLVELLTQQASAQADSSTHVHDDTHSHGEPSDNVSELVITVEIHDGDTHIHVEEPGKDFAEFWLDGIEATDEDAVIAAVVAQTSFTLEEVTASITFPSDDAEHDHDTHDHGNDESMTGSHGDMDLSGIHIMGDGSVMLGDGTPLDDATVNDDDMIVLGDGTEVEPVMDMR